MSRHETDRPLILLTNDDGIDSPGLLAAVMAVAPLGELMIVAPHEQQTAAGRSFVRLADRRIYCRELVVADQNVPAFSIKGTPAQAVATAMVDLIERPVDLLISGINFGANIGNGITISGTVGAALEAASHGAPALAVSLQTPIEYHHHHSTAVDFSVAAHFTRYFAERTLAALPLPSDVDILKIDIPAGATPETPWRMTIVSRQAFSHSLPASPEERGRFVRPGYARRADPTTLEPNSDIRAVIYDQVVSVSPVSLNLSSRVNLSDLHSHLQGDGCATD